MMRVIGVDDIEGTDREVKSPNEAFTSLRLILERDEMGFGLHVTRIPKGGPWSWHYKNHLEACYCVSGRGLVTNSETGHTWDVEPGVVYILDKNDKHSFLAITDVELISVFNPPLTGAETHDETGSYERKVSYE